MIWFIFDSICNLLCSHSFKSWTLSARDDGKLNRLPGGWLKPSKSFNKEVWVGFSCYFFDQKELTCIFLQHGSFFVRARTSSEAQFSTSEKHSIQCIITLAYSFLNVFWKRSEDNWTSVSPRSRNAKNTGKLSYNSVGHITVPEIRGNFFRSLVLCFKLFRFTLTWLGGTWVTFLQEWLSKSSTFLCVFNVSCDPRYRVPYLS